MIREVADAVAPLANIATLPSTLAHELTHAVVAMPYADDVFLSVYPEVFIGVDYQDNAPRAAKVATAAAPLVSGAVMGTLTLAVLLATDVSPNFTTGVLLAFWWAHYTISSIGDFPLAERNSQGERAEDGTPEGDTA